MEFTDEQKRDIQNFFEKGEYGLIARTAGYWKDADGHLLDVNGELTTKSGLEPALAHDWRMVTRPEWRWDLYEYRAYSVVDTWPDLSNTSLQLDPRFVFGYGYKIYYNEAQNNVAVNLYDYTYSEVTVTSAFNCNVAISGDFHAMGATNTIGVPTNNNTTLTIMGKTHDPSEKIGPKIRFENADSTNYVDLIYSDQGSNPTLTLSSSSNNEIFVVPREKVTTEEVTNESVTNLTATSATVTNLTVTNLTLKNVADVLYPVGSYYWSTTNTDPSKIFGGTWQQIKNAFLYATTYSEPKATTATHGESTHVLTTQEIPTHSHGISDPSHSHSVSDPGHSHVVNDPGHWHPIRTVGDDYNGSNCKDQRNTGNFVGDGQYDMTNENNRRGLYAINSRTGISINTSYPQVSIQPSKTNISIISSGGGGAHNNMPPYIAAYCWHRIA